MIRCNECFSEFLDDDDLSLVYDKILSEWLKGCPICKTDKYLMDIQEGC